jgi:glycosyltransferase involved in cell wall biosynthesis
MFVSVVICTRNRARSLARALSSIAAAEHPKAPWEVLVVDNGSTDETPITIASFEDRLPIRRVDAPIPGLSNARNQGVEAAKGQYFVWTDDDVVVDRSWLTAYVAAFEAQPEAAVFAGQIIPELEAPITNWFEAGLPLLGSLTARREFTEVLRLTEALLPYGANFAVRGAEQRRHLFDPNLGVAPGRRKGGEETSMVRAVLEDRAVGYTVPKSLVYHQIPSQRQTADYIAEYYVALGEDLPLDHSDLNPTLLMGAPRWYFRRLWACRMAVAWRWLFGRDWLPYWIEQSTILGIIKAWQAHTASSAGPDVQGKAQRLA